MKGIASVLVIGILAVLVLLGFTGVGSIIGATTLSVSSVNFKTSDPVLAGQTWAVTFAQGGLGQSFTGTVPASMLQSSGGNAQNGFTVNIIGQNQIATYPIQYDPNAIPLYKVNVRNVGLFGACQSYEGFYKPPLSFDGYCISQEKTGEVGRLQESPNINFNTDIELVEVNGVKSVAKIDSQTSNQVRLGNMGYVVWNGNLVSGTSAPSPSGQGVFAIYTNGKWVTADRSLYDYQYVPSYNDFTSKLNNAQLTTQQLTDSANKINSQVSSLQMGKFFYSGAVTYGTLSSGSVAVSLGNQIQVPVFTMYVKADSLGIVQPVPKPVILSVSDAVFRTGDTGYAVVQVKNDGESGNIAVGGSCPSPLQVTSGVQTVSVSKGQTATVALSISGTSSGRYTATCTATATALSNSVSKQFSATVDPIIVCSSGSIVTLGDNKIWKCNAGGSGYDPVKDCTAEGKVVGVDVFGSLSCVSTTQGQVQSNVQIDYLNAIIVAIVASLIILGILYAFTVYVPVPFLQPLQVVFSSPQMIIGSIVFLTIMFLFVFTGIAQFITSSVIGGFG